MPKREVPRHLVATAGPDKQDYIIVVTSDSFGIITLMKDGTGWHIVRGDVTEKDFEYAVEWYNKTYLSMLKKK